MNYAKLQVLLGLKSVQDERKEHVVAKPMLQIIISLEKIDTCYWEFQLLSLIFSFGVLSIIQLHVR